MSTTTIAKHPTSEVQVHIYLAHRSAQLCLADDDIATRIRTTAATWRMIKAGRLKITHKMLEPIAQALDLDSKDLFRRVLNEYSPDLMVMIDRMFCAFHTSERERRLIEALRDLLPDPKTISFSQSSSAWSVVQTT